MIDKISSISPIIIMVLSGSVGAFIWSKITKFIERNTIESRVEYIDYIEKIFPSAEEYSSNYEVSKLRNAMFCVHENIAYKRLARQINKRNSGAKTIRRILISLFASLIVFAIAGLTYIAFFFPDSEEISQNNFPPQVAVVMLGMAFLTLWVIYSSIVVGVYINSVSGFQKLLMQSKDGSHFSHIVNSGLNGDKYTDTERLLKEKFDL